MEQNAAIHIDKLPKLRRPVLIIGLGGWGNALNISKGMAAYLIRALKAQLFANINTDMFYRYDESRPVVRIEDGEIKNLSPPGGKFFCTPEETAAGDIVIFQADEPQLKWEHFTSEVLSLCEKLGVEKIISLGSMWDNVLHSDRIISGIASDSELLEKFQQKNVIPINYNGPSAIHSMIYVEGQKQGIQSASLWCHCPYYLHNTTHYGVLAHLGNLLSFLGEFSLDTSELDRRWEDLDKQIQALIENDPKLQVMITELRKAKVRGSFVSMKDSIKTSDKVIKLSDFLDPK